MIGASILNTELTRPHDTFMEQIKAAWHFIRGDQDDGEKESEGGKKDESSEAGSHAN